MEKFKNKYRVESARLYGYDYGQNGAYFITICTKDRFHHFGKISNGKMILSEIGNYATEYWRNIPQQFPFVKLDEFIVMPNHIHGIIIIDKDVSEEIEEKDSKNKIIQSGGITGIRNPMFHENISRIIRLYKGRCSFEIRKFYSEFKWQARFHDHIVRNEKSFNHIQNYILNNPLKWSQDTFYN